MAFGWLVWSLVLSLVGGDFLRKILCIFLIWLFVCSPVMAASTSDSQLDFDNSIMPLSSGLFSSVTFKPCHYVISSDTFYIGAVGSTLPSSAIPVGEFFWPSGDANVTNQFDYTNPYYGFCLDFSGMSNSSSGSSWKINMNGFGMIFYYNIGYNIYPSLESSSVPIARSWAYCSWSGMGKYTSSSGATSWRSIDGSLFLPVDISVSNVRDCGGSQSDRLCADYIITVNFNLPKKWTDSDGDVYEVTSSHVDEMRVIAAYEVTPATLHPVFFSSFASDVSFFGGISTLFANSDGRLPLYVISSSALSGNSGLSGLQQSIGQMGQNLTKQINEVKSTIQQGANEVKNEIKSQTQTITDKLTAVKDDIVGGITDLKETTTQGFKDVVQGITDLPGKIGEMLQGLIVPDSEKVSGKFEDFNNLAEEKLGVIYQVPEMVISMAQSIVSGAVEQKGEMTLPKFELIMPATNQSRAGESLVVWEEYTFPIWPEGTEVIHTAVQTATSMLCVILTFNALKRKYEDWLDGK